MKIQNSVVMLDKDCIVKIPKRSNCVSLKKNGVNFTGNGKCEPKVVQLLLAPPITKMIWKYQSYYQTTRRYVDVDNFNHVEPPKFNEALMVNYKAKASAFDIQKMEDAIRCMTHSKLDLVLFCNAYESEEIAYENLKMKKKAIKKGKLFQRSTGMFAYEDQHDDEEYLKLKREVMEILSKKLFIKCLALTEDVMDRHRSFRSKKSL